MTSGHLAEAIAWFSEHEADRRGVDGTAYEVMKRRFSLTFSEAVMVCREVRKLVGPYPSTPGGAIAFKIGRSKDRSGSFFRIKLRKTFTR